MAGDALSSIVTFLYILSDSQFCEHVQSLDHAGQPAFLTALLDLMILALRLNVYPEVWVVLITLQCQVICRVYGALCPLICSMCKMGAISLSDQVCHL